MRTGAASVIFSGLATLLAKAEYDDRDGSSLLQSRLLTQDTVMKTVKFSETQGSSRAGKGSGGKGSGTSCLAAEQFCFQTLKLVSGCEAEWRVRESAGEERCSQAFCNVERTLTADGKVQKEDAKVLRHACKNYARSRTWGSDERTCPTATEASAACTVGSFDMETLMMDSFCSEMDFMCDSWALWFIETALEVNGDEGKMLKYCKDVYAPQNDIAWKASPTGCDSDPNFNFASSVATSSDAVDPALDPENDPENDMSMVWQVISSSSGCQTSSDEHKPEKTKEMKSTTESECKEECAQRRSCTAIDYHPVDQKCMLFNWACQEPEKSGWESWRLVRGDAGVGKKKGNAADCGNGWEPIDGFGDDWEEGGCPAQATWTSDYGCLVPAGSTAQCICRSYSECTGVATVYDDAFFEKHPGKAILTKGYSDLTKDCAGDAVCEDTKKERKHEFRSRSGKGTTAEKVADKSLTCAKKSSNLLIQENQETFAEAASFRAMINRSADQDGADALLETAVNRKGCIENC